jgi:hypothetical protein
MQIVRSTSGYIVPLMVLTELGQIYLKVNQPVRLFTNVEESYLQLDGALAIVCATLQAVNLLPEVHYLSPRDQSPSSAPFTLDDELYAFEGLPVPIVDFDLEFATVDEAIDAAIHCGVTEFEVLNCWANTVHSSRTQA